MQETTTAAPSGASVLGEVERTETPSSARRRLDKLALPIAVAITVCVLVLPRCFIDYGESGDALDNATDATQLAIHGFREGIPLMVRWPPGVPAFHYMLASVVPWGGHIAANLLVFAFFVASIWAFYRLTKGLANQGLLVGLFALTPLALRDAALSQDFVPGMAFVLMTLLAIEARKDLLAGLFLGIATGCRITTILLLAPAAIHIALTETNHSWSIRLRRIAAVSVPAVVVGMGCYVPFVYYSGLGWRYFVPYRHGDVSMTSFTYNMAYVFGPIASAILGIVLFRERHRFFAWVRAQVASRSPRFVFAIGAIGVFAFVSFRFPNKVSYFLPAIPFIYLLLAEWISRRGLCIIAVGVLSFSFVNLELKGGLSGRRTFSPHLDWGCVVYDWMKRNEIQELRHGVGKLGSLRKAIVLTGMGGILTRGNEPLELVDTAAISPRLDPSAGRSIHRGVTDLIHRIRGTDVFLIASMSQSNIHLMRSEGFGFYMFSEEAPTNILHTWGYDPYAEGINVIEVFSPKAFYRADLAVVPPVAP
jgi:hypothetical protein